MIACELMLFCSLRMPWCIGRTPGLFAITVCKSAKCTTMIFVGVRFWSVTYVCPFAMLHYCSSEKQRAERKAEVKGLITAGHGYGNSPTLLLQLDDEGHAIPAS